VSVDDVGVVVLAYGAGGEYLAVLRSLADQGVSAEQIVVVHNPSERGERLPPPPEGCEVVSASHNLGYAAGMNLGIRRQLDDPPEFVLLLTHDASLRAGALGRLVAAARSNLRYGVLGPSLLHTGSDVPFSFGGLTSRGGLVHHRKDRPPEEAGVAACDWVDGGTMLIRSEALAKVGGFDERFWGYCEDAELCLRVQRAGFAIGVVVDALADQAPGGAKRPGPWAYLLARNRLAFARRAAGGRGVVTGLRYGSWLVLSELARTLARATPLRPGRPAETWAVAVGTARGMVDFARRRWGPPPTNLPGAGDLKNLAAPTEQEPGNG
jgi:N-acetylglucosaminyl-diphospho-decaprenol L-rhamnosyltransferase